MIPVLRTKLPTASKLYPYLEKIDDSKIYSNYGPMVENLTCRIAEYLGLEPDSVVLLSNATAALEGAIINSSSELFADSNKQIVKSLDENWYVPSFTFPATVHALVRSGKDFRFTDVDNDWYTIPISRFGIQVLQFGAEYLVSDEVESKNQSKYQRKIIDAAGSFDACNNIANKLNLRDGLVISFHATKTFSTGEGGLFASKDKEWVKNIRQWSNFGLWGSRIAKSAGTNAKMSEYSAAIGLAFFDEWNDYRTNLFNAKQKAKEISNKFGLKCSPSFASEFISNYWVVELDSLEQKNRIVSHLNTREIETREWWANGCHEMPAFKSIKYGNLSKTIDLASKVVGLPMGLHLSDHDFVEIEKALSSFPIN
jgi:dTDP-4-amino-4,6-dideoxygalactose transaminase